MKKLTHPEEAGREERIGGAGTCDLCHCKRDSEVSDPLIAPHIKFKGDKESLLTCSLISQESRNKTFCRKILHQVLAKRKNLGLDLLTSQLETAHWAGGIELLSPLMAQGHRFSHQASCLECLPPSFRELSCVQGEYFQYFLTICPPFCLAFPSASSAAQAWVGTWPLPAAPRRSSPDFLQIGSQRQYQGLVHSRRPFSP